MNGYIKPNKNDKYKDGSNINELNMLDVADKSENELVCT